MKLKKHCLCALFSLILIISLAIAGWGQAKRTEKPVAPEIDYSSLFNQLRLRNIGPAVMGGRTVDLAVVVSNTAVIYAAVGPSGVWKSTNSGVTWEPVFHREPTVAAGAVAVSQSNPDIVWVGSGERTSRNSVGIGDGVYKSEDGGKTWKNMGLADTRHIARIIIDPLNPDVVYIGALGHLFGPNEDRGVFKTTDGGKAWKKLLYVNADTGCADMAIDPSNNRILYAGMWDYRRNPYYFRSGGEGSAIYKTTDGGETWKKITGNGLPDGLYGRIGLGVARSSPNVVYALIENKDGGLFRSDDKGETWRRMCDKRTYDTINFRPFYYSRLTVDPNNDLVVYVYSGSTHVSRDAGKTYEVISRGTHPDHHAIWVNPHNSNHIIDANDGGIDISYDGGKTWYEVENYAWSEVYQVGLDKRDPYFVYVGLQDNGSWGGPSNSLDRMGIMNHHWYPVGGGDGFYSQVDPEDYRIVYRNLQMGRLERHNIETGYSAGIQPKAPQNEPPYRFNWNSPIYISPHNPKVLYFGGNFLFKSLDQGRSWTKASPDLSTNDPKKQQDSGGPITADNTGAEIHCTILTISESPLQEGVIWVGTDDGLVQLTKDGGKTWTNLTKNIKGLPPESWVSRIEASHHALGTAYATFDRHWLDDYKPHVYKTEDFGATWVSIKGNLPDVGYLYVVREDPVNKNLLFVGSEFGLFVSFDGGKTWVNKWKDFPTIAVRDIQIHPREKDLVIGTHGRGVYILDDIRCLQGMSPENMSKPFILFEVKPSTMYSLKASVEMYSDPGFAGENPPYGAGITFYLKDKPGSADKLKLTIVNAEGKEVRALRVSPEKGINRVYWDLREEIMPADMGMMGMGGMTRGVVGGVVGGVIGGTVEGASGGGQRTVPMGAAGGSGRGGMMMGGGIYVLPGEYGAVLDFNGAKAEQKFEVKPDPKHNISIEERQLNRKYAKEISALNSRGMRYISTVAAVAAQLDQLEKDIRTQKGDAALTDGVKALRQKIEALQNAYGLSKEGQTMYRQPVLIALRGGTLPEQLRSLAGEVPRYPGAPTQTQIDLYKGIEAILLPLLDKLDEVMKTDIPALNKLLREKNFPHLKVMN